MSPAGTNDVEHKERILLIRSARVPEGSGSSPSTILRNYGFLVTTVRSLRAAAEQLESTEEFDLVVAAAEILPQKDLPMSWGPILLDGIRKNEISFLACEVQWVRELLDSADMSPIESTESLSPIPIPLNSGRFFILSGVCTALEYFRMHAQNRQFQNRILQMHENERRFRTLVENQGEGIGIVDPDERFVFANPAGERIFGLPLGGLVGRSLDEFTDPEEYGRIRKQTERRSEGLRSSYEMTITGADGVRREILLTATPQFDEIGTFSGTMGIFLDVTERNRMARALGESERKANALLEEKELLLREVHHRIKNNLSMIISLLSLKIQSLRSEIAKDALTTAINRIQGIRIIYEMLHLGSEIHEVSIRSYIPDLLRNITDTYRTDNITITPEIEDISMDADTAVPAGILINELVTNAVKYAFPDARDGSIRVICRQESSGAVHVAVSDDGIGLPEDVELHTPQSFGFRLIRALVNQLSGEIDISRENGTHVTVRIPL